MKFQLGYCGFYLDDRRGDYNGFIRKKKERERSKARGKEN